MLIQNINNPNVKQELSKEQWKKLGKRQSIFRILDEKDSDAIKQQTISNSIGKKDDKKSTEEVSDKKKPTKHNKYES